MTLYVDASAFVKVHADEHGRFECAALLAADTNWITARHTLVEVRRNLARALDEGAWPAASERFFAAWARTKVVELDSVTCLVAAELAIETGARTLDALHLAAAWRTGPEATTFLTYDIRLAKHARTLGFTTLGT